MHIETLHLDGHPDYDQHEQVLECRDDKSGLHALIAIHNTRNGPALGGRRMWPYSDREAAISDVLRLSRGMSYKSALTRLPLGGGKAVIIGDPSRDKTRKLLLAMADFIETCEGRYITSVDSGTSVADLQVMRERSKHISGIPTASGSGGNPSPTTAYGSFIGLQRAVAFHLGRQSLDGITVAIQGVGNVGYCLARYLTQAGAKVYVCDIQAGNVQRAELQLGATGIPCNQIHGLDVDVFSPCAMGGTLNDETIAALGASIVAGAANNQLARPEHGLALHERGVLYAPDYVINAGGIIDVCYQHFGGDADTVRAHVDWIPGTLGEIFQRASSGNLPTSLVADRMAQERVRGPAPTDGELRVRVA